MRTQECAGPEPHRCGLVVSAQTGNPPIINWCSCPCHRPSNEEITEALNEIAHTIWKRTQGSTTICRE